MLKRLLNVSESETDRRLREVCDDFGAKVYAKVRVADVLPIENSGIDNDHYKYALQAHFDFVIADSDDYALLAVEFDGGSHSQPNVQKRDKLKNDLCEWFKIPLLRINRRYLTSAFSNWDLLRWFATVFFVKRSWDAEVEAGRIATEDSIFDPIFASVRTKNGFRSLELERQARAELGRMFRAGMIPWHVPSWLTALDADKTLRAISWINVSDDEGVVVETAMQHHNLDDWVVYCAIRGIVLTQLLQQVGAILSGAGPRVPVEIINERVRSFESQYQQIMALRSGRL